MTSKYLETVLPTMNKIGIKVERIKKEAAYPIYRVTMQDHITILHFKGKNVVGVDKFRDGNFYVYHETVELDNKSIMEVIG